MCDSFNVNNMITTTNCARENDTSVVSLKVLWDQDIFLKESHQIDIEHELNALRSYFLHHIGNLSVDQFAIGLGVKYLLTRGFSLNFGDQVWHKKSQDIWPIIVANISPVLEFKLRYVQFTFSGYVVSAPGTVLVVIGECAAEILQSDVEGLRTLCQKIGAAGLDNLEANDRIRFEKLYRRLFLSLDMSFQSRLNNLYHS